MTRVCGQLPAGSFCASSQRRDVASLRLPRKVLVSAWVNESLSIVNESSSFHAGWVGRHGETAEPRRGDTFAAFSRANIYRLSSKTSLEFRPAAEFLQKLL